MEPTPFDDELNLLSTSDLIMKTIYKIFFLSFNSAKGTAKDPDAKLNNNNNNDNSKLVKESTFELPMKACVLHGTVTLFITLLAWLITSISFFTSKVFKCEYLMHVASLVRYSFMSYFGCANADTAMVSEVDCAGLNEVREKRSRPLSSEEPPAGPGGFSVLFS